MINKWASIWNNQVSTLIRAISSIGLALACLVASNASLASSVFPTPAIGGTAYYGYASPDAACQAEKDLSLRTPTQNAVQVFLGLSVKSWLATGGSGTWVEGALPYNTPQLGGWMCFANYQYNYPWGVQYGSEQWIWIYPVCPPTFTPGTYVIGSGAAACPSFAQYFLKADPPEKGCCVDGSVNNMFVGDPINPSNGNMYQSQKDHARSSSGGYLQFGRYYNSDDGKEEGRKGWRYMYGRSVTANFYTSNYLLHIQSNPSFSPLYNDESEACVSGFPLMLPRILNWAGAVASYSNNTCTISKAGVVVGTMPVYSAYKNLSFRQLAPVSYEVTRDDGQLIRFTINNGVITPPPGIKLKLQQTSSGYTIMDSNDNVEQYDSTGKLVSITSRGGVVQTMNYDGNGRLNGVSDSFGHQLIFNYDAQGRLTTVTRQ